MNHKDNPILLVEDDLHLRNGLHTLLSIEGFPCTSVESGEEALRIIEQSESDQDRLSPPRFSLFLLDVSLPGMDGFEVCRRIRQNDALVPIIFLTARTSELDCLTGFNRGADHYITKPFRSSELIARIRAILTRANRLNAASESIKATDTAELEEIEKFTLKGMVINPSLLTAERDDRVIALTKRELKVLQLLYQQKNQVVSRDQLMDHCWGRKYIPESRALDQFISALRKKIEQNQSHPEIITTVHSVGYCYQE